MSLRQNKRSGWIVGSRSWGPGAIVMGLNLQRSNKTGAGPLAHANVNCSSCGKLHRALVALHPVGHSSVKGQVSSVKYSTTRKTSFYRERLPFIC